ncbi:hypothetical protein ACWCPI_37610 [Streptomyces sp. NPDC001920]
MPATTASTADTFVGNAIGYAPSNADILYRNAIPAKHIESIAFPGDPAYDGLPGLPTARLTAPTAPLRRNDGSRAPVPLGQTGDSVT